MHLFFFHSPGKSQKGKTNKNSPLLSREPLDYTDEGDEFLDDAIRMKDQPLMYGEESVTAGHPEDLLRRSPDYVAIKKTIEMTLQEKQLMPVGDTTRLDSLDERVTDLKKRGYQLEFRREADCLTCNDLSYDITPENFTVDEYYHFEDGLETDRERTIYAISSIQGLKGFLVEACSVYEDNISLEMAQKLRR
jgi:hypothetical protein